jgi:hypothetical protein
MGHIIAAALFILVIFVIVVAIKPGAAAREHAPGGQPVGPNQPAADEPTPGASVINDPATMQEAQRHVPPA